MADRRGDCCAHDVGRSLVTLIALGAMAVSLPSCSEDEGHVPKLRRTPRTERAETEPRADAGEVATPTEDASAPTTPTEVFVSDLDIEVVSNGWGPVERDTSNGEDMEGDGNPITLGGVVYPKGLGVHAASEIVVALDGQYTKFLADVGVDDEVAERGSIVFQVVVDGETLFDSGVMTGDTETKQVSVDVTGKQQLELIVTDAGDGIGADHGDWANARLVK